MKIIVTGASGFIGGAIVHRLAQIKHYKITAIGRSICIDFEQYDNVIYQQDDLSVSDFFITCDICIHSAGLADDTSSLSEYLKHNVLATSKLINRLSECKQFIFISSASVYTFDNDIQAKENSAVLSSKLSPYGRSKLLAEQVVLDSDIASCSILRPRAVYGNGDKKLIPRILKLLIKNRLFLPKNLSQKTSLTNINNFVDVIYHTILHKQNGIEILNVCDDRVYSLEELFAGITETYAKQKIKITFIPETIIQLFCWLSNWIPGISLNKQSLGYLRKNSVLDISNLKKKMNIKYQMKDYIQLD